jgi:hypothetical protein
MKRLVSYIYFKKRGRECFKRYKYSYLKPQLLRVIVKERSNHIVLKTILDSERVRVIVDSGVNKSYALTKLAEKFRVKKK